MTAAPSLNDVAQRVRELVVAHRADDPAPDDPFRGLYLAEANIAWLLARDAPATGTAARLAALADTFRLSDVDVVLLTVALAPDLDGRFERFYGYLNDDVSRRRATVGLALELGGYPVADPLVRARLAAGSPLLDGGLLVVEEQDTPLLGRPLRVPDRVCAHLLGDDTPAAELLALLCDGTGTGTESGDLAGALGRGLRLCHLRGPDARAVATSALHAAGFGTLVVDLGREAEPVPPGALVRSLLREARLTGAGLVVGPASEQHRAVLGGLCGPAASTVPVLLTGTEAWNPDWAPRVPLPVDAPAPGQRARCALWRAQLDDCAEDLDPVAATEGFRLGGEQIVQAARAARDYAALAGRALTEADLRAGARAQNGAGLDRLARRITPGVGWSDLVLPEHTGEQLRGLADRARHRERVLGDWAMRPGGGRGAGVTALFTGESGTGKTTAAEVIAAELGMDLYAVELSTVVDKYVGETEKNLDRIFREAAGVNGVLLFDEADAIFGKRSAVADAHDRYANLESAYLLQRMESFDGLAILATNLRANLDEAFTRRLDLLVEFPLPDERLRAALWDTCLGDRLPRAADLDLVHCARTYDLAGGDIRSAAVSAAYAAAAGGRAVCQADLLRAVRAEYRKLGRLNMLNMPAHLESAQRQTRRSG